MTRHSTMGKGTNTLSPVNTFCKKLSPPSHISVKEECSSLLSPLQPSWYPLPHLLFVISLFSSSLVFLVFCLGYQKLDLLKTHNFHHSCTPPPPLLTVTQPSTGALPRACTPCAAPFDLMHHSTSSSLLYNPFGLPKISSPDLDLKNI